MKPMSEQHFAILRRHMVELIGMHMDLMSVELRKSALDERVAAALMEVPRHLFVELWPNLGDASWWGGVSWRVSKPARTSRRSDTP